MAPKGKYIAFVTTEAETDQPEVELKRGIDLLGPVDEIFYETYDRFEPKNDHEVDHCFISTVSGELCLSCASLFYMVEILIVALINQIDLIE